METPTVRLSRDVEVTIPFGGVCLHGTVGLPGDARGLVLFAHGTGSGRDSPRNRFVAHVLQEAGIATLLVDLLEEWEVQEPQKVRDIELLAERLLVCTKWLRQQPRTRSLSRGYFGSSAGAAVALQAAAMRRESVAAIVSRGGRPDLAAGQIRKVSAPTLLIVGGEDRPLIRLNEAAYAKLAGPKEMAIVPGATHLFEEPGTLEKVADLTRDWFARFFGPAAKGGFR
jgi:putative phosphoribosyl transferase